MTTRIHSTLGTNHQNLRKKDNPENSMNQQRAAKRDYTMLPLISKEKEEQTEVVTEKEETDLQEVASEAAQEAHSEVEEALS